MSVVEKMDLFSEFCNICYKFDDGSLKDISKENVKHLIDTVITFVGHPDIIKHNVIYLCQLCCEELTRFDKFRKTCVSNLVHMRQRYLYMKSKLEFNEGAAVVKHTLKKFVQEEVLRRNSLAETNRPISISTEYLEYVKSCVDFNKNDSVFNSDVSVINSVTQYDESRVAFTNEYNMKNEMPKRSEDIKLEFERKSDEGFAVFDINNGNESDTEQTEFVKEEFDLKNEIGGRDLEKFALKTFENESAEHVKLDVVVPVLKNSEGSINSGFESRKEGNDALEDLELETTGNESRHGLHTTFEFVNVQETGDRNIRSGEDGIELPSNSKSAAGSINRQHSHVSDNWKSRSTTAAHELVDSSEEQRTCGVCKKMFRRLSDLARHERVHSGNRSYKCTVCNKMFIDSATLTSHECTPRNDKPYTCTVCKKSFDYTSHLVEHVRTHNGDRPFKCTVCNKSFKYSSNLAVHGRIHSGDRPYKCIVCNMTFTQLSSLSSHERRHSGDRPFNCIVCSKTFATSSSLSQHKRAHSDDTPFKCTVCNKSFRYPSNLAGHTRIHSSDRQHKCTVCNKTFTKLSRLTAHEPTHWFGRPYKCTVCNKTFAESYNLKEHKRIHSGDRPYKCTVCNKTFRYSSNYAAHKHIHGQTILMQSLE